MVRSTNLPTFWHVPGQLWRHFISPHVLLIFLLSTSAIIFLWYYLYFTCITEFHLDIYFFCILGSTLLHGKCQSSFLIYFLIYLFIYLFICCFTLFCFSLLFSYQLCLALAYNYLSAMCYFSFIICLYSFFVLTFLIYFLKPFVYLLLVYF